MKRILAFVLVAGLLVSNLFGNATDDLFLAVPHKECTVQDVETLISLGADVKATNGHGATALMLSALLGDNPEIVKCLVNAGADVNARAPQEGFTLLSMVAGMNKVDMAKALIELGADVNARAQNGWTVLMMASELSSPELIKLLVVA